MDTALGRREEELTLAKRGLAWQFRPLLFAWLAVSLRPRAPFGQVHKSLIALARRGR
jgi:hypothetical protein